MMQHREFAVGKQTLGVSAPVFQVELRAAEVAPLLAVAIGPFCLCDCRGWLRDGRVPPTKPARVEETPSWSGVPPGEASSGADGATTPEPGPGVYVEEAKLVMCPGVSV